jgi:hypothetical protein
VIPVELEPKEYTVLRAAVRAGPVVGGTGSASMVLDGLTEGALEATWSCTPTAGPDGTIAARVPDGATVTRFVINGEERRFEALDGEVRWEGPLPEAVSLRVTWRPEVVFEATREQIAGFPFVDGDAPATVVLPSEPGDRDRYLAEHLSIYFDYWHRRQEEPWGAVSALSEVEPGPQLPIAAAGEAVRGPQVVFAEAQRPTVRLDGQTMFIEGPDAMARETAMLRLLDLLDQHRPHYGAFPEHPMYEKAGMVGRTLEGALREANSR